ncbi:amino acid adenylation domain-containing protein [Aliikangiella maris]|uniref:Amino acid adenylation domain-containing protein n=2 Tax=Aliikangiella maris TaxID=3162458 RepID=A0ABV2BY12_9GAMM
MQTLTELLAQLSQKSIKLSVNNDELVCYAPKGALNQSIISAIEYFKPTLMALLAQGTPVHKFNKYNEDDNSQLKLTTNHCDTTTETLDRVYQIFVQQVKANPHKAALIYQDQKLSYLQLLQKSQQLAEYLIACGIQSEMLVAICMPKCPEMIIAILGCLMAGAAYVPVDPDYPTERINFLINDSQATIGLTHQAVYASITATTSQPDKPHVLQWICVNWEQLPNPHYPAHLVNSSVIANEGDINTSATGQSESCSPLAYVIYTSGTTGQPKGVMIEHASLLNHNQAAQALYQITAQDNHLLFSSISFDLFVEELFISLNAGATIVIEEKNQLLTLSYLRKVITQKSISVLNLPTALFHQLVSTEFDFKGIKTIIVGGEALAHDCALACVTTYPELRLFNTYGPTETTIICTAVQVTEKLLTEYESVPIGKPIANISLYLLNEKLQPVLPGESGEICVSGIALARGYWNQPQLTQTRFPFCSWQPRQRLYQTGDLAKQMNDGQLIYLGRIDQQLKLNGFRIEPSEIESQLHTHPDIQQAVVFVHHSSGTHKQLIAAYTSRTSQALDEKHLQHLLNTRLPKYMCPGQYFYLSEIPLTVNGKVDYQQLQQQYHLWFEHQQTIADSNAEVGQNISPESPELAQLVSQLVQLWCDISHITISQIKPSQSLTLQGGHSLAIMQLAAEITAQLECSVSVGKLFQLDNLEAIARWLVSNKDNNSQQMNLFIPASGKVQGKLTAGQQGIWLIDQMGLQKQSYNEIEVKGLRAAISVEQCQQALNFLVERHSALRTVFNEEEGIPYQKIIPFDKFQWALIAVDENDVKDELGAEKNTAKETTLSKPQQAINHWVMQQGKVTFNLSQGPLFHFVLLNCNGEQYLLANIHHIICDGWSFAIFWQELDSLLDNFSQCRSQLKSSPINFIDYAVSQSVSPVALTQQLGYWQQKLQAAEPTRLALSGSLNSESFAAQTEYFSLGKVLTQKFNQFANDNQTTQYVLLLSILKLLVFKYTGTSDICIGTANANRNHAQVTQMIGMFVNSLALRTQFNPTIDFTALLHAVKTTCYEAYANQQVAFEKIVEVINPQRDITTNPFFQIMLVLQTMPNNQPFKILTDMAVPVVQSKFDFTLEFEEVDEQLYGRIVYRQALYSSVQIRRLLKHYLSLCQQIVTHKNISLAKIDILSLAERQQIFQRFNRPIVKWNNQLSLFDLFYEQVIRTPDKIAVFADSSSISYRQLYARSLLLADYLKEYGVKLNDPVVLMMPPGTQYMIGLFALLAIGASYVPLDPDLPVLRITHILNDCSPAMVLISDDVQPFPEQQVPERQVPERQVPEKSVIHPFNRVNLDTFFTCLNNDDFEQDLRQNLTENLTKNISSASDSDSDSDSDSLVQKFERLVSLKAPHPYRSVHQDDIVYIIYTSGSTGKPKGVANYHSSLINLCHWYNKNYQITSDDKTMIISHFGFDLTQRILIAPLITGAQLILNHHYDPEVIVDRIKQHQVSWINCAPSSFYGLVEADVSKLDSIKRVILGGEKIQPEKLMQWFVRRQHSAELYNSYGPTETCAVAAQHRCHTLNEVHLVGKPIDNVQVYILNSQNQLQPVGVAGELCIAGAGVAKGYINQPILTEQKFIHNPFVPHQRIYKTGDMARWTEQGELELIGRIDQQVKLRGYRIEIEEIEAAILQLEAIKDCAVVVTVVDNQQSLIAFYVLANRHQNEESEAGIETEQALQQTTSVDYFKQHLKSYLPNYMIPTSYNQIDSIPRSVNGKTDRQYLQQLNVDIAKSTQRVEPKNQIEQFLLAQWSDLLRRSTNSIGTQDSFFETGGHSLLATQLISRIRGEYQLTLTLKDIFTADTICAQAEIINTLLTHQRSLDSTTENNNNNNSQQFDEGML